MVGEGEVDVGIPHGSQSCTHRFTDCSQRRPSLTASNARHGDRHDCHCRQAHADRACRCSRIAAALYLLNLSATGYGNLFYAAAAQAGSHSWSAWFFGSLDANNFITVDKPPALWVTGLSVRLFGMNSWAGARASGVDGGVVGGGSVRTVRRAFDDTTTGTIAGLLAGAALACTPAAALIFRFNNPDALLVLVLTAAAYCVVRAVESASWRWLALVGAAMGAAFLTKMLEGFLPLPAFAATYLLMAPTSWRNRLLHLLGATAALVATAAAGWWVLTVQLVPATARPYVGGSTDNTVMQLAVGYNGMTRILGRNSDHSADVASPPAGHGWSRLGGGTGVGRLFTAEMANEISLAVARSATNHRLRCLSAGPRPPEPRRRRH